MAGSSLPVLMRVSIAIYATLICLLSGRLLAAAVQTAIPTDPAAVEPLAVGDRAPEFTVRQTDGTVFVFNPNRLERPHVLIFYCGGWCPYCNARLNDLGHVEVKLRDSGFAILFLSTHRPELLCSSLKAADIRYTPLSDNHLQAAEAFHIAYHLDDTAIARQREFGVDLERTTGTKQHELPVPSVFIIDRSGTIRFVNSNPEYTVRLGAGALWAAASPFARVQ